MPRSSKYLSVWPAFVLFAMLCAQTVAADRNTRADQLVKLFAALKAAGSEATARGIEADIQRLWLKSGRRNVDEMMRQAREFVGRGLLKAALDEIDDVLKVAPDFAEGWNKKATVLFMLGRDRESISAIQKTLELEPRHFGALAGLGLIGIRQQNWKGALNALERAVAINPWLRERRFIPELVKKVGRRAL